LRGQQKASAAGKARGAWKTAGHALARYLGAPQKADALLDEAAQSGQHAVWLLRGALRWHHALEATLGPRLKQPPRPTVRAWLHLALFEIWSRPADRAQIVHFAVEMAKRSDGGGAGRLLNGVLRGVLRDPTARTFPAAAQAHPSWLVERWQRDFGGAAAMLTAWNQQASVTYLHVYGDLPEPVPAGWSPTPWAGFWQIQGGPGMAAAVKRVEAGEAYFQDPSTRHPVQLAYPQPGQRVLDLCAAPGGKTSQLARAVGPKGHVTALDLPGPRLMRLKENVARLPHPNVKIVGVDLLSWQPPDRQPYDVVLLDAPCSNTGVLQRRPDTKMRLTPQDFVELPRLQLQLLQAAAPWVRPGGHLIYSTCSVDPEENAGVVRAFCTQNRAFALEAVRLSYPWRERHDGGAAFRLTRRD